MVKQKESVGFKDVLTELKNKIIRPLYVFEGEEHYLKNKLLQAIESLLIDPSAKSLDYVALDYSNQPSRVNLQQIESEMRTPPFLSQRRLIVIKNSGLFSLNTKSKKPAVPENDERESEEDEKEPENQTTGKDRQAQMIALFGSATDSCCLVFIEDKVDKRMKAVVEKIQETGLLAVISKPDLRDIRLWVKGEFAKCEISILPDVCDYFIDRNDGHLQNMVFEIQKLCLLAQSKKKSSVDKQEIDEIGSSDLKGSIFDIVDALSRKNAQEAYRLLDLLLVQKQPVPLISFMLARHVRQLIAAKDSGSADAIAKRMKVIPFVAAKLFYQAKNFTFESLEDLYQECYESDLAVKTSKIPDRLALELLFASTVNKIQVNPLIKRNE